MQKYNYFKKPAITHFTSLRNQTKKVMKKYTLLGNTHTNTYICTLIRQLQEIQLTLKNIK